MGKMAPFSVLFSILFIISIKFCNVNAKIAKGELDTRSDWQFIARFCFLSLVGRFEYEIEFPISYQPVHLLLYYDSSRQWPAVYGTNKTCREKEAVLSRDNGQLISLAYSRLDYTYTGCRFFKNQSVLRCKSERRFESRRERWWFIAISKCGSKKGLKLRYEIHMTNHKDNFFKKHFSADEFGILETDITFTIAYYIIFVITCISARFLHDRHLLHQTFKLFMLSVFCKLVSLLLLTISYALYASDGEGNPRLKLTGQTFEAISSISFLLLLILIAKGYTVTRGRLKGFTSAVISVFMTVYCVCYSALFIYEQKVFDPGLVLYIYDCLAGYLIIILRLMGWGLFVFSTVLTMIRYPAKSAFYTKLFLVYTFWFLSAPVIVLMATFILGKWMREKIINGVEHGVMLLAHIVFLIITRPSSHNDNFPFHVRTTQIDIMEQSVHGRLGEDYIDNFTQRGYAPTHFGANGPVGQNISIVAEGNTRTIETIDKPPDYFALFGVDNTLRPKNRNEELEYEDYNGTDSGISMSEDHYQVRYTTVDRPSLALPPAGSSSFLPQLIQGVSQDEHQPSALVPSSQRRDPPTQIVENGIHVIELNR